MYIHSRRLVHSHSFPVLQQLIVVLNLQLCNFVLNTGNYVQFNIFLYIMEMSKGLGYYYKRHYQ